MKKSRMLRFIVLMLAVMLLASGCNTSPASSNEDAEYRTLYSGEITTLNYLTTATTSEFGLAANLVDSLIDYDNYGVAKPALATEWSSSDDGLVWTLKIREGVNWMTHEGEEYAEVKAQDWVDAAEYLLDQSNESSTANIFYSVIKNAEDYYNGEITDFEQVGVKAIGDYELEYTLKEVTPYFESMLNYVCFLPVNGDFLEEAGSRFGTDNTYLLYNGSYIMEIWEPQTRRVLVANEDYWDSGNVHIGTITQTYNQEAATLAPEMFLRGEVDYADISAALVEEWMKDDEKANVVRPSRTGYYTYFYCLNFDPQYAEEYEPDNWKIAVNNRNFRKALFYGLNRVSAMTTAEAFNPENRLVNTITPRNFVSYEGVDFTEIGGLKKFTETESFNEELAKDFRDKAMSELQGKASFPIIVYMPYNAGGTEWGNRAQVIEQQMEALLGEDFIDIQISAHPPTNFLSEVRRVGNYAFLECNWGPDYADPETYTGPFYPPGEANYNFPELVEGYDDSNGKKTYTNLVEAAMAEVNDMEKRYELFAEAEAFLIEEAFVVPYAVSGGSYVASKLSPFDSQYSPFGVAGERFKGQRLLDEPMNSDKFKEELEKWEDQRAKELSK